jgi:hypothetical protein
MIKSGVKTTEFVLSVMPWVVMLVLLALVAAGRVELLDIQWIVAALGIGGSIASGKYSESRGNVKSADVEIKVDNND